MTQSGDGRETPDEFAHLFRPDSEPVAEPVSSPLDEPFVEPREQDAPPSDPFSDWEPLVAVPQAVQEATPQGGMRFEDPPLPVEASSDESDDDVIDEVVVAAEVFEEPPDNAASTPPTDNAPITPPTDPKEGRLFRSRGAVERADAITAVGTMQARRLRTMARGDEPSVPISNEPVVAEGIIVEEAAAKSAQVFPTASRGEPAPALQVMAGAALAEDGAAPERSARSRREERREERRESQRASSGSLTGLGVYAVTIGVTLILAFGETLVFGGEPGVITGIGLLVVSIFAAFAVRTYDGIHAIFAPSIAFFVVTL
ncbi:MAG: hypothetical protein O2815_05745, partial [Actinomycetota bacterium]|nr:hypothetical protein [Actinomycetota bacterium]